MAPELLSSDVKSVTNTTDNVNDLLKDDLKNDKVDKAEKPKEKPVKEVEEDEPEEVEIKLKGEETEEDEEDEDKIDLKEDEDKEEELSVETPPRKKDIVSKYPKLFKDFPFLEKMMFRDRQYTELFGSFDDAKEVAERSNNLAEFEHDLLSGNTEKVLSSVKSIDKKAFDKIVDNYLPTLARVDKEAYFEVVGNIGKEVIKQMAIEAKNSNNEDLQKAALLLNQFLFGTSTYTPPKQRVEEKTEKSDELEKEKQNFTRERFETARGDLQTKVDNTLRATISDYIDPKGEMSSYVKKNAVRDALNQLHESLGQDVAFRRSLDKLWEGAFGSRFSQDSLGRIRSTYLGRAKQTLATVIKKARAEALKDNPSSSTRKKDEEDEETPRKRGPIPSGRPHQSSGKLKWEKGESVKDFLSRE